ncbi:kinase-like protein [Pleomassaria siparia CBS 279.74]|uniref:non-specific serine/threonine protein kinase n=1 Tax=Pleomassaria siparia CBS 279.74 TaxID=1314801 RepID=A0A6G1KB63_9PLEO|nr:kinase-like protein [Pleomassaria siparia CBS 279.74]
MSTESQIHKTDRPTFKILKWIGAGGFGNVFKVLRNDKIVACKQIETDNLDFALDEHRHMTLVRGGPHIAAVHDGIEWNAKTKTLSFFMDYYKGKDLNRQVEMLRATGERFTEFQIIDIAYQIAVALEHCHGRNLLHQDMKPMNILLSEAWDPTTQGAVPHLFLADFGIASHVQTIGTRLTGRRGTPGYEAPVKKTLFPHFPRNHVLIFSTRKSVPPSLPSPRNQTYTL